MSTLSLPGYADVASLGRERARARRVARALAWLASRWMEFAIAVPVIALTAAVHGFGMDGWPPIVNDDEGTYMAQAWAVLTGRGPHHGLAQYTYWYDHPPVGWIQLAVLSGIFHVFHPGEMAVVEGRHLLFGYALVSTALVYLLARRIGCSRIWAGVATLLFGVSPLSVDFLRQVFIDCVGLPWIIAAFVIALSPRRRLWSYACAGAFFAIGCLSKETYLLLLPAVAWQVWQAAERSGRKMAMTLFTTVFLAIGLLYPLYAALKGELFPGEGHVSLFGSALWQVDQRAGSGSVLSASSASHDQVMAWLHSDPWLLGLGVAAVPLGMLEARARPVTAALVISGLTLFRHGYLPYAFVVSALPFAAVVAAAGGNSLTLRLAASWPKIAASVGARKLAKGTLFFLASVVLVGVFGSLVWKISPEWTAADRFRMSSAGSNLAPLEAAESYVAHSIPKGSTLLVDDDVWTDFVEDGFQMDRVVWVYKLDLDPAVVARYPRGWRDMDYVVETPAFRDDLAGDASGTEDPKEAVAKSRVIATFGSGSDVVKILKVIHPKSV